MTKASLSWPAAKSSPSRLASATFLLVIAPSASLPDLTAPLASLPETTAPPAIARFLTAALAMSLPLTVFWPGRAIAVPLRATNSAM